MSGVILPKNMVTVTTTIDLAVGGVTTSYTTSLTAQTHKLEEIDYLIERAWDSTKKEAGVEKGSDATPTV